MKHKDFLADLLGNPARARLLRVFMFDSERTFSLKDVAKRSGVSVRAAARELKVLEKLELIKKGTQVLVAEKKRAKKGARVDVWSADRENKYFSAISKFVHGVSPMRHDVIVETLKRSGKIATVILSGNFMGDPTRPADMLIAGEGLNDARLEAAIKDLEPTLGREIRYASFTTPELRYRLTIQDRLIRDTLDFPHLVLLDRTRLL